MTKDLSQDALFAILRGDAPLIERCRAAVALGIAPSSNPTELAPQLNTLMDSIEDWEIRQNVIWAAGELRATDCESALLARIYLPQEDEQVRYIAALALLRMGTPSGKQALETAATSEVVGARQAARAALDAWNVWQRTGYTP